MSGIYFNPLKRIFLNLSGGTVTGDTVFTQGVQISSLYANSSSATTFSADTINSGTTNLYQIFSTLGSENLGIQPGTNIQTGGTLNNTIVSIVDSPSFANVSISGVGSSSEFFAIRLSGETILSGDTDLYDIFVTTEQNDITRVQPGSNIITGGTGNNPIISIVASPSFYDITSSGITIANIFSASTVSANTFVSGGTNLYEIFSTQDKYITGATLNITNYDYTLRRNDGVQITTNLGIFASDVNITGGTYDSSTGVATFYNNSGGSFYVSGFLTGFTDIYTTGGTYSNGNITLRRNDGNTVVISGLYTGYTAPADIYVTGGTYNGTTGIATFTNSTGGTFSVNGFFTGGIVTGYTSFQSGMSASTINGEIITSGGTNLYDIFLTVSGGNDITRVQPGSNITTGGTGNNPIVSVVANPSFNDIIGSGTTILSVLSATSIYVSGYSVVLDFDILNGGSF